MYLIVYKKWEWLSAYDDGIVHDYLSDDSDDNHSKLQ